MYFFHIVTVFISRGAEGPGREILQCPRLSVCPSVRLSVCLSVTFSFRTVTQMFFSHFMLFPTFIETKIWEYKTIISHLMFSSCFFLYAGNIEKCPFTYSYWLNGRWFLQIVDIGNFIMRLEILKSAPSLTG